MASFAISSSGDSIAIFQIKSMPISSSFSTCYKKIDQKKEAVSTLNTLVPYDWIPANWCEPNPRGTWVKFVYKSLDEPKI